MTENKYYIPDITEFRIGFEYEVQLREDAWAKYTFPQYPRAGIEWNTDNPISIIEQIKKKYLKVKYLNQEDIESFGFAYIRKDELCEIFIACRTRKEIYRLEYTSEINLIRIGIYDISNTTELGCVFNGVIKNKSELQILLKQLVIN